MRKTVALIVAAGLLVAVAGCSSTGSGSASGCTPMASSGAASDLVTATGDFGTAPTLTVSTPLFVQSTQVTTLAKGDGPVLPADGVVSMDFVLVDGTTGAVVSKTPFDGSSYLIAPVSSINVPGLRNALTCQTEGSRLAITIPPSDEVDPDSATTATPTDPLVLIVDIRGAIPGRADGAVQPAQAGFPSVALGPDGRPGITIPSGDVPTSASTTALKKGDGATVANGEGVWVQYTAVSWSSKAVVDSTWSKGAPVQVTAGSSSSAVPDLVGQSVGSQYISVVPASPANGSASSEPTVYVVDVLGITPVVSATQ